MAGLSDAMETAVLNSIFRQVAWTAIPAVYASLHTADPGDTGTSEVTGGSYARMAIAFGAPAAGAIALSAAVDFAGMPATTVTHVGMWSAVTGGTYLGGGATTNKTLGAGDTYRLTALPTSLD